MNDNQKIVLNYIKGYVRFTKAPVPLIVLTNALSSGGGLSTYSLLSAIKLLEKEGYLRGFLRSNRKYFTLLR